MTRKASGDRSLRAGPDRKQKTAKNRVSKARNKPRKLKPRQQQLLKGLIEGKSVRAAALDAGYSPNTAQHPSELLDTVAMREALGRLLAPPEKIAQRINEGLDAMETKFFQFEGKVSDSRNVIAWSERRMYADLASELKGLKPSQKIEHGGLVTSKIIVEMQDVAAQETA